MCETRCVWETFTVLRSWPTGFTASRRFKAKGEPANMPIERTGSADRSSASR